jgi:L-rhamnose mutarotase
MDANNPKVQACESFVLKYQQGLPMAKPSEKWVLMKQIFKLTNQ